MEEFFISDIILESFHEIMIHLALARSFNLDIGEKEFPCARS